MRKLNKEYNKNIFIKRVNFFIFLATGKQVKLSFHNAFYQNLWRLHGIDRRLKSLSLKVISTVESSKSAHNVSALNAFNVSQLQCFKI